MKPFKSYLLATSISFVFGVLYGALLGILNDKEELFILAFFGSLIATAIIAIINLLYFLPVNNLKIKYITPGLIIVLIFYFYWSKSYQDLLFFLPIAFVNLGFGIFKWNKMEKAR